MKSVFNVFILAFTLSFLSLECRASEIVVPPLSAPVVDQLGIFKPAEKSEISRRLLSFQSSDKIQMAVLVSQSLGGYPIESVSLEVVEKWQLGKKGEDQGLLLLIAPKERKVRFEVGYGLEGVMTDAYSSQLIRNVLAKHFKKGEYGRGVLAVLDNIEKRLELTPVERQQQDKRLGKKRGGRFPLGQIFWLLLMILIFFGGGMSGGRRRRGLFYGGVGAGYGGGFGRSSGGFGGGFSGGGGGFGGGGASGSW